MSAFYFFVSGLFSIFSVRTIYYPYIQEKYYPLGKKWAYTIYQVLTQGTTSKDSSLAKRLKNCTFVPLLYKETAAQKS